MRWLDAVNAEQNNGTLTRLMARRCTGITYCSQVLRRTHRKRTFVCLALLMIGGGLVITAAGGTSGTAAYTGIYCASILYVGFWSFIWLSVRFRNATTSALTAIGIWLFFTVFYRIIVNVAVNAMLPSSGYLSQDEVISYNNLLLSLLRLAPSQLYTDAATTLLMPSVRSLGPLTMEQMAGAIPSPLPFKESLMIVWPQVTGLLATTTVCFALSYYLFMRREIRS